MKRCALITEYNPFHNGHYYHLLKAKEITDSESAVAVMNGNFTQRGIPAIIDKWARTEQALKSGVDLVIELPLLYGLRSAKFFASAAVNLIKETGLIDTIVFGSENENIDILKDIAYVFNNENKTYKKKIKEYLNQGLNYPTARNKALIECRKLYNNISRYSENEIKYAVSNPNNILGIEYLKAVQKNNININIRNIKRKGPDYHSSLIEGKFASASLIRKIIRENDIKKSREKIKNLVPPSALDILSRELNKGRFIPDNQLLIRQIIEKIRRLSPEKLLKYPEIANGLENRIFTSALNTGELTEFLKQIHTKNYTNTRIMRSLLYIWLNIKKKELKTIDKYSPPYIRILGLKKGNENLLTQIKHNSALPLIINPSEILRSPDFDTDDPVKLTLSFEIMADDLYSLLRKSASERKAREDYHKKLIKI
ncbi:nucleotidyltransferase [Halanaerobium sp. MA284_MarDTE_T2]|uniref:nucleotidyltransferase n=1 Tax=Halanaerobium sp. MA284_MarDTE_T2 TaxID=2183913 RepID=UPI000DF49BFE|nr:nucleotidyltransferase [Halanaerobium sp. MA284_MarDTE_T2]RCW51445.1 putative nucleotidyltransferase [Halanaerobium sp. MA284_MarDTE_T2]